jgi:RNA polymerase sigma-70 factor (ECF subfamily)
MSTDIDDRYERAWKAHHAHLTNVAFRMLGDIGAAEDAVQDAYARLLRVDPAEIQDERGWLIVVTSRLCLDQIRSARSRLDQLRPTDQFDLSSTSSVDPGDRVTLDDNVRAALQVVLARLNPAERVAFVMHDVFQVPYETIAETVGRPVSSCRQLAARARKRIADSSAGRRLDVDRAEERRVTDAFITACTNGDTVALLEILDPEVSGDADFGDLLPNLPVTSDQNRVSRNLVFFFGQGSVLVSHPTSDEPAVLAFTDDHLACVIFLTIEGGRVRKIHVLGDPPRIEAISEELAAASALDPG